jgi:hypothetical protein
MLPDDVSQAPHCEDEVPVNSIVDSLGYEDCKTLFRMSRFEKREHAKEMVEAFLEKKGSQPPL